MRGLVYHELGHIWHDMVTGCSATLEKPCDKSIWQLFREGFATYIEQLLCEDEMAYHQNENGWLEWCEQNKSSLWVEYKRRTEANESTQPFFGDWCSYRGHSNIGYYLGSEFVKVLAKTHSMNEIRKMDINSVKHNFMECEL